MPVQWAAYIFFTSIKKGGQVSGLGLKSYSSYCRDYGHREKNARFQPFM